MNIQQQEHDNTKVASFMDSPVEDPCLEEVVEEKTKQKLPNKTKEPQRYDELKIKDGPIYNWSSPNQSTDDHDNAFSSNDSLLTESDENLSSQISYIKR